MAKKTSKVNKTNNKVQKQENSKNKKVMPYFLPYSERNKA